jgi:hypothetical protein
MVLFLLAAAAAFLMLRHAAEVCFDDAMGNLLVSFEELHRALVLLCLGARTEGPEIASLAGTGVAFARVQTIFSRFELADHMLGDASRRSRAVSQATCSIRAWLACKIAIRARS